MEDGRARRLTLAACILGSAVVFVDGTVVNVALPAMRDDLDAALSDQQWIVEAYLLALGALLLVGGSLGDIYDRRAVFATGTAGFGVTSLLCAAAPSSDLLIAARALQGVSGALLVPSSLAIISEVFPPGERARAIGIWTAWTSAAIALGPPLGGVLVDAASWRWVFAINVPLVAACLLLTARGMPACGGHGGRRLDPVGAVLCTVMLGAPVFALIRQADAGWGAPEVWLPLAAGAPLLAAFIAWEARRREPMMPLSLFAVRNFAVGNAVTLAVYAGLGAATFFVSLFLQQVSGYSATAAGLALVPITILMVALASRFGALSERIGPRALMGAGPVVAGAGLLWLARLDADPSYAGDVLPGVAVFGLGLAMTVAPLTATVLGAAVEGRAGIASGVNNAVARVAGLVAIAAVGAVVAARFDDALRPAGFAVAAGEVRTVERAYEEARRQRLSSPELPAGAEAVEAAITDASVSAFRAGMAVSGLLVIAGGLLAFAGIENPRRRGSPEWPGAAGALHDRS